MKRLLIPVLFFCCCASVYAQPLRDAEAMAATAMKIWPDTGSHQGWTYDQGVVLEGIESCWEATGDGRYFKYLRNYIDKLVDDSGNIKLYKPEALSLDNVKQGRLLLSLFKVTGQLKYYKAAQTIRAQFDKQPRTADGGFWHKKIYPHQMWLDGLYMGEPFYAEYAADFHQPKDFDDIAKQFILMEEHGRDPKTGLLYHGWDESKEQKWADKTTGQSPTLWSRAMGWYGMGLVDVLDYFPQDHPDRPKLITALGRLAKALSNAQDGKTGLWWQVADKPGQTGNYPEASASCMFVYILQKGVRKGYLPAAYSKIAAKGWDGIGRQFVKRNADGSIMLSGTAGAIGLGGTPYRDGSYAYYTAVQQVENEHKGVGTFMMAGCEMDMLTAQNTGKGKTVMLDNFFNNESHKDVTGAVVPYHYTWEDRANSGFSTFGHIFNKYGAATETLRDAPTVQNLKRASVFIIVDPDTKLETASPNFMNEASAAQIYNWVKAGGVLLLMENDSLNSEFTHFNMLAEKFGIHYNENSRNRVVGTQFETGTFQLQKTNAVFKSGPKVYMKEISTLRLQTPAQPVFTEGGDVIMATAKVGKGWYLP